MLEPLAVATAAIQIHATAALLALGLGVWLLIGGKGTPAHRRGGALWVAAMGSAALSSFFINEARQIGPFSAIHLLSVATLIGLPVAVLAARRGNRRRHALLMQTAFWGGLVLAGALSLAPGRLMHAILIAGE